MYYDKFFIKNREGKRLSSLLFLPSCSPRFQLVVAHGFRGAKENRGRIETLAEKITDLGGLVLAFDFCGSGESEGVFSEMSLSRQATDLVSVIDFMAARDSSPVIALGRSFGGSTALAVGALDQRVKGLVLWSTAVLMEKTFSRILPKEWGNMINGNTVIIRDDWEEYALGPQFAQDLIQHDFSHYLESLGGRPILVIHGEEDVVVDPENAIFVKNKVQEVELHMIPGADHRFSEFQSIREDITCQWLNKYFCNKAALE